MQRDKSWWTLVAIAATWVVVSCTAQQRTAQLNEEFGKEQPRDRQVSRTGEGAVDYWADVEPLLESRCVVCHGCYDSPCQLKLTSIEGVERGGSKALVYEPTRLLAAKMTRLYEDAHSTDQWREQGFHPVLNERANSDEANLESSVLYQMLSLKREHPLPEETVLEGFDFSLDRKQTCPTIEEFPQFEKEHPDWGMPYGLPALSDEEFETITRWLEQGAVSTPRAAPSEGALELVRHWEAVLNRSGKKEQLIARYLYEHLFLSHFYFPELGQSPDETEYFELVRSKSPPGQPVQRIATRRPFDDPGVPRVHYRLVPLRTTVLEKTHMPYALDDEREQKWASWFYDADFRVQELPTYKNRDAANPFATFLSLPVRSRYRFMLDEARHLIEGFIKGPVCRGQTSLNVINDRFWITFLDPKTIDVEEARFYAEEAHRLTLPAAADSNALILTNWIKYSKKQHAYLKEKAKFVEKKYGKDRSPISLDLVWDGDGTNRNAALTVFRHDDSATVEQGLLGPPPKTAWVLGYGVFERIHYLLVAGFDVWGNVGHQLNTRIYMDFLRMEAETNFLGLLPSETRPQLRDLWYEGAEKEAAKNMTLFRHDFAPEPAIEYTSHNHALELYEKLQAHLAPIDDPTYAIDEEPHLQRAAQQLEAVEGGPVRQFAQVSWIRIANEDAASSAHSAPNGALGDAAGAAPERARWVTLVRDNAHQNILSLFKEEKNRRPERDHFTLLRGMVGAYPNAFFRVKESEWENFVRGVLAVRAEDDYAHLKDRWGVRRTDANFWSFSDLLHAEYVSTYGRFSGRLDFNRLENR